MKIRTILALAFALGVCGAGVASATDPCIAQCNAVYANCIAHGGTTFACVQMRNSCLTSCHA